MSSNELLVQCIRSAETARIMCKMASFEGRTSEINYCHVAKLIHSTHTMRHERRCYSHRMVHCEKRRFMPSDEIWTIKLKSVGWCVKLRAHMLLIKLAIFNFTVGSFTDVSTKLQSWHDSRTAWSIVSGDGTTVANRRCAEWSSIPSSSMSWSTSRTALTTMAASTCVKLATTFTKVPALTLMQRVCERMTYFATWSTYACKLSSISIQIVRADFCFVTVSSEHVRWIDQNAKIKISLLSIQHLPRRFWCLEKGRRR